MAGELTRRLANIITAVNIFTAEVVFDKEGARHLPNLGGSVKY